ncbi:MAG: response regulator [Sedimentisphaerales bacterium]|nr:response regulator [Sedimentisphaerales bacterium]
MNILIVEDNFASRKLLHVLLSKYGQCDIAVNGRECVEAFKAALSQGERYDLICLDVMMPVMDGHEALEIIREVEKRYNISGDDATKVIMTSASSEKESILKSARIGCDAYLVKPIQKDRLSNEIKKLGLEPVGTG